MVDADLVTAKLGELSDRLERVRSRCPAGAEELGADRDALELVAFNLMLAVQSTVDIASHIIADEGYAPATTLRESFERLEQQGILTSATARALAKAASLRNVVAHGYAAVDLEMLFAGATRGVADLEAFAREVAGWLGAGQR